jgi:MFS family permease
VSPWRPRSPLWRNGDFLRLWAGQTVSELGGQVTLVALPLTAILVLDASAFEVGVLSSLEFLPFLVFGLVAGVWVDRLPYRRVLVAADLGRAAVLGTVPLAYLLDALTLPHLYAVGFLAGTLTVFFSLAYQAYLPVLLERVHLVDANSKLEVTRSVAQTAGPAAGGGLVAAFSAPVAILADAVSFLVSGGLLLAMRHREQPRVQPAARDLVGELREGLRYVWQHPIFRPNLLASGLANFSYGIVWAILLVFAVRSLELEAGVIGLVLAVGQAGGIAGALLARRIAARIGIGPALIGAIALCGPAYAIVALATPSTAVPFLTIGWTLLSFASLVSAVLGVSIRQALVPQHLQGRVVGATRSVILGAIPLGALVGGVLAAAIGLRPTLLVGALVCGPAFVPLLRSPVRWLRELPATEPTAMVEVGSAPA